MKLTLDSHAIELTCPRCRGKFPHTLGQLNHKTDLDCPLCRTRTKLDQGNLRAEIAKIEQSLAQLGNTPSRIGQ